MTATKRYPGKKAKLINALIYMAHNLRENVTVKDLAEHVGCSRVTLISMFSKAIGQTPGEYFWTLRSLIAGFLINRHPELKLGDVAAITGFKSPEHFTRRLKVTFGCTPKHLRDQVASTELSYLGEKLITLPMRKALAQVIPVDNLEPDSITDPEEILVQLIRELAATLTSQSTSAQIESQVEQTVSA